MQPRPGDVEALGYGSVCLYVFPTLASLLIPKWFPLLEMVGTTLASPIAQIKTAAPRRLPFMNGCSLIKQLAPLAIVCARWRRGSLSAAFLASVGGPRRPGTAQILASPR
jgi:hypothetical protein